MNEQGEKLMGLKTTHECQIEYAPAPWVDEGKGRDRLVGVAGTVSVSGHGLHVTQPQRPNAYYAAMVGGGWISVAPEHIDGLIRALHEARIIGVHLFGHGKEGN